MKENKRIEVCVILLCIIVILPLFIISIYNRPSADDYDYAILTHKLIENEGNFFSLIKVAWDTNIYFYNTWQGLYSSAFILALQPGIFGAKYYAFTTLIVSVIAYICLLISIHIFNRRFLKKSFLYSVSASAVLLTVIMLWLPSAVQGLYWYNGAMNYIPFCFLTILNISLLFEAMFTNKNSKSRIIVFISTILSFIISGGNHITAFANILVLFILAIMFIIKSKTKKRFYILIPLLTACVGFLLVYMAPGTIRRQMTLESQTISKTIFATLKQLKYIVGNWVSFSWIITLIIITPTAIEIAEKNENKFSKKFPVLPIFFAMIVIAGMLFVPYLTMGSFGAERITNVIWIAFMIFSWTIYFFIWGYIVKNKYINLEKIKNNKYKNLHKILILCSGIIILLIFPSGDINSNSLIAIEELLNGVASNYCFEMDERIKLYENKNLKEIKIKPLETKSKILFFYNDITTDPNQWPNHSIGRYYNKVIYLDQV